MHNIHAALVVALIVSLGSMLAKAAGIPESCEAVVAAYEAESDLIERYGGYEIDLYEYVDLTHSDPRCAEF
jgi:hypothetical protein